MSASGRYVVLDSAASNLVDGDTNGVDDVFIYDVRQRVTGRVSVTSAGYEGNGHSSQPAISSAGRYVVFRSSASNLVAGDSNGVSDVFIYDRTVGSTARISVDGAGGESNGPSSAPAISGDGRYVAFASGASNLVAADTNAVDDVFVRDRLAGTTTRVSVDDGGGQAGAASARPSISGDGGSVAFDSAASNLVVGDTNNARDVLVRSLALGTTRRVSVGAGGLQGSGASGGASISSDGRRVAFESVAPLDGSDRNGVSDVYVRDRLANATIWASGWAANQGWQKGGASTSPAISGDGRYVALALHSDVNVTDLNRARDIYEYDLVTGQWAHISRDDVTGPGNQTSDNPALSADGTYAVFESLATNFYPDTNGVQDTFMHQWVGVPSQAATTITGMPDTTSWSFAGLFEDQHPPSPCGLGKPAAPSVEASPRSAGADRSAGEPTGTIRLVCRTLPVPLRPPVPEPRPEPPVEEDPDPRPGPIPVPPPPFYDEPPRREGVVFVYHRVSGNKKPETEPYRSAQVGPNEFRDDADGVSAFELPVEPESRKPYLVPYAIEIFNGNKVVGAPCRGTLTADHNQGSNGPHWSLNCDGDNRTVLSVDAVKKRAAGLVECNPAWTTDIDGHGCVTSTWP